MSPVAFFALLSGFRAERLDPDLELSQRCAVAHGSVDHETRPTVRDAERGDHVADQCNPQRGTAVDDQHRAFAVRRKHPAHERVVFERPHGANAAVETRAGPPNCGIGRRSPARVGVQIDQIGGEKGCADPRMSCIPAGSALAPQPQPGAADQLFRRAKPAPTALRINAKPRRQAGFARRHDRASRFTNGTASARAGDDVVELNEG